MAHEQVPDDFDWVSAQAKCSAALMFDRLRAQVQQDVQHRNGIFNRQDGWRFEFHDDDEGFEVTRLVGGGLAGGKVAAVVRFERAGRRIHVMGEDIDVEFTAVVTLDVGGVCRYVVGEAVYSEWEIRRMALEQLFFEEEPDEPE